MSHPPPPHSCDYPPRAHSPHDHHISDYTGVETYVWQMISEANLVWLPVRNGASIQVIQKGAIVLIVAYYYLSPHFNLFPFSRSIVL
jgi:hypothetical protein